MHLELQLSDKHIDICAKSLLIHVRFLASSHFEWDYLPSLEALRALSQTASRSDEH